VFSSKAAIQIITFNGWAKISIGFYILFFKVNWGSVVNTSGWLGCSVQDQ
jgi:hypothetical protein